MAEVKTIKRSAPKFWVGETVETTDGDLGVVQSLGFLIAKGGWFYSVSAKELDIQAKAVIDGIMILMESELKEVKEEKKA